MNVEILCRCCGVPVDEGQPVRMQLRVCVMCDRCDGMHGAVLEERIRKSIAGGGISPGTGLARAILDDAQLTGRIVFKLEADGTATALVPDPPERWRVMIARCLARRELPDVSTVVYCILERWLPANNTRKLLESIRADLIAALQSIDPDIQDVQVDGARDVLDPEHLIIKVLAKQPVIGIALGAHVDPAVIPSDIMNRPRGSA